MEEFVIGSGILGTLRHLSVSDKGYTWSDDVGSNQWFIDGQFKDEHDRCLDTLFCLNNVNIDLNPSEKFITAMHTVMSGSNLSIPWHKVMPKNAHRCFTEALIENVKVSIAKSSSVYYDKVWVKGNKVTCSLRPALVDKNVLNEFLRSSTGSISSLTSFFPKQGGYVSRVRYNRFGTRTGRITVQSGPQIMTLKKEHRAILKSRWGSDGAIALYDFAALEARVLLYESGKRCDHNDLYDFLNKELFDGRADRNLIKGAVISELYGQSVHALGAKLGIFGTDLYDFVHKIKIYFETKKLLKRIKPQFIASGYILNRYGRMVHIDEPMDHIIINSYAQSTGADISMLGFAKLIDQFKDRKIVPLFLLHDAIIFDCHKDELKFLDTITHVNVEGYVQKFPLRFELLPHCT